MAATEKDHSAAATEEQEVVEKEKLVENFSRLNAKAPEFVPSPTRRLSFAAQDWHIVEGMHWAPVYRSQGRHFVPRRRFGDKVSKAQREERIRRTIYVSDVDPCVTEEQLAELFSSYGDVIDCRICGDPSNGLRFGFVEFETERGAKDALCVDGTPLGVCLIKVSPSKTAILPVNPLYLPQSEAEKEMSRRTVYCTNIDKMITQPMLRDVFQTWCGQVSRIRLLGDHTHETRIAFVEFAMEKSAVAALNSSGMYIGNLPIRVTSSKTPIRTRVVHPPLQDN